MTFCSLLMMESSLVCCGESGIPHWNAVRQYALSLRVIGHPQLFILAGFPEDSQEVQMLLCLFNYCSVVGRAGELVRGVGSQGFEGVNPFHTDPLDVELGWFHTVPSNVQYEFLGFCDVQC